MHDVFRYCLPGHFWEGLYVKWVKLCLLGTPRLPKKIWGLGANPLYGAQGAQIPQNGPPGPHRGGWPPDPKFFLGSLGVPNRHNFTH